MAALGLLLANIAGAQPHWIWHQDAAADDRKDLVSFRQTFTVVGKVERAELFATCDNGFKLWLNENEVAASREWSKPVRTDVRGAIQQGGNILAVEGEDWGGIEALLVRLTVQLEGGKRVVVETGPTWKAVRAPAKNWQRLRFDDSAWQGTVSRGLLGVAPWGALGEATAVTAGKAVPAAPAPKLDFVKFDDASEPPLPAFSADSLRAFDAARVVLERRCGDCHTGNSRKAGLSFNSRHAVLAGGENGGVVTPGDAARSKLYQLVVTKDEDDRMPPKGEPLTADEARVVQRWIETGLGWREGFAFGRARKAATEIQPVTVPDFAERNPLDSFLAEYFAARREAWPAVVDDRLFARRVHLDLVGLLPAPERLDAFVRDLRPDKRARLVEELLADRIGYADHWLTFWNDLLRNNYYGTGFIDDGRRQITDWLYAALLANKPYDQFARELIGAAPGAEGYIKGIVWRGVVNASQRPVIQAAQNVAQVFLGTNLKCASCHDSFVDGWSLAEAYAFASVFEPAGHLELVRCDKPLGRHVQPRLLFPALGSLPANAPLEQRRLAAAGRIAAPDNGLFARTMVNRLWKTLFGQGLVEPVDVMANDAWHPALLDWLANDFIAHGFDLQHTLRRICTSRAYQLPAVGLPRPETAREAGHQHVFRGPYVRRLTAEQLFDAVATLTGDWQKPDARDKDPQRKYRGQGGQFIALLKAQEAAVREDADLARLHDGKAPIQLAMRASAANENDFLRTLGRPNREQVVSQRDTLATTLQALELTNGATFDAMLRAGAAKWRQRHPSPAELARQLHREALGREPTAAERAATAELLGSNPGTEQLADLLWAVLMQPEFQLIY